MACDPLRRPTVRYRGQRHPVTPECLDAVFRFRRLGYTQFEAATFAFYFHMPSLRPGETKAVEQAYQNVRDRRRRGAKRPYYAFL